MSTMAMSWRARATSAKRSAWDAGADDVDAGFPVVASSADDRADGGFVAAVAAGSDARCGRRVVDILFGRDDFRYVRRHVVVEGDGERGDG
jgi:hypothetical protein